MISGEEYDYGYVNALFEVHASQNIDLTSFNNKLNSFINEQSNNTQDNSIKFSFDDIEIEYANNHTIKLIDGTQNFLEIEGDLLKFEPSTLDPTRAIVNIMTNQSENYDVKLHFMNPDVKFTTISCYKIINDIIRTINDEVIKNFDEDLQKILAEENSQKA